MVMRYHLKQIGGELGDNSGNWNPTERQWGGEINTAYPTILEQVEHYISNYESRHLPAPNNVNLTLVEGCINDVGVPTITAESLYKIPAHAAYFKDTFSSWISRLSVTEILKQLSDPFDKSHPFMAPQMTNAIDSTVEYQKVDGSILFWSFYGIMFFIDLVLIGLRWRKTSTKGRAKISLLLLLVSLGAIYLGFAIEEYTDGEMLLVGLSLLFVILIILAAKNKKIRENFSSETKKEALSKQHYKCAVCDRLMNQWDRDFDHKNGDRSDNRLSNCRALHPRCHRRTHAIGVK